MIKTLLVITMMITVSGCSSSSSSSGSPVDIAGRWAGTNCTAGAQGFYRPEIGFSGGRIAIRTYQFTASDCSGAPRNFPGPRSTADYSEQGIASDTISTEINVTSISINAATTRHNAPRLRYATRI